MTDQLSSIAIQPLVIYPRKAQVGKTYLMTVDLQSAEKLEWQYEEEEYPIYCKVDGNSLINRPLGEPVIVLHRFGGSYGEANFLLTPTKKDLRGQIRVCLINKWGVPFRTLCLEAEWHDEVPQSEISLPSIQVERNIEAPLPEVALSPLQVEQNHDASQSELTLSTHQAEVNGNNFETGLNLSQAQRVIFDFLLEVVKVWHPRDVLEEFRHLFIHHTDSISSRTLPALHVILFANDEQEFRSTLKRCCYILINNWQMARQFEAIQDLVDLFSDPIIQRQTLSPTLKRLRFWLSRFVQSYAFEELRLYVARYTEEPLTNQPGEWANRYTAFLLVPQYVNEANPIEQRQAAQALSRRLKERFNFNLSMYVAYDQQGEASRQSVQNPTALGDSTLRLVKALVAKRSDFSYKSLARLFWLQVHESSYGEFKRSLPSYLLYTVSGNPISQQIQIHLESKLVDLYAEFDRQPLDQSLVLRTSNRMIDCLLMEDDQPSSLFSLVLHQGNALTLAIILLKLVLLSRQSLLYLEAELAKLIRYYEQFPQSECQWFINFLEVFQIMFAIYAGNTEYSLVEIKNTDSNDGLSNFRIVCQTLVESPQIS